MRNLHAVFHSGCTNLHSYNNIGGLPFSAPSLAFLSCRPFMMATLTSVRWYLRVLISISLIISDDTQLFMYLLAIHMSSLENVYLGLLPIFWLGCLLFLVYDLFMCCWILFASILLRISASNLSIPMAYNFLFWSYLSLLLVSGWWQLHKMSLGVFPSPHFFGRVWEGFT